MRILLLQSYLMLVFHSHDSLTFRIDIVLLRIYIGCFNSYILMLSIFVKYRVLYLSLCSILLQDKFYLIWEKIGGRGGVVKGVPLSLRCDIFIVLPIALPIVSRFSRHFTHHFTYTVSKSET